MIVLLSLLILILSYLEFLWKNFEEPTLFFTIRKCHQQESSLSTITSIRSFLLEQYSRISLFLFNSSLIKKQEKDCQIYKINLHVPLLFFILKSFITFYFLYLLLNILVRIYEKLCYFILEKQIKPFVHIRSVALISTNKFNKT